MILCQMCRYLRHNLFFWKIVANHLSFISAIPLNCPIIIVFMNNQIDFYMNYIRIHP